MRKILTAGMLFLSFAVINFGCSDKPEEPSNGNPVNPISPTIVMRVPETVEVWGDTLIDFFTIRKWGEGELTWTITDKPEWLELSETSGTLTANRDTVVIKTDLSSLPYGDYEGQIQIDSNAGPATVKVTLSHQQAVMQVWKPILNLDRHVVSDTLFVTNEGGGLLRWRIIEAPDWVNVSATQGLVTSQPGMIFVRAELSRIDYGEYQETIKIESNGGDSKVEVYLLYEREVEVYPGYSAASIKLGDPYSVIKKLYGDPEWNSYTELPDDMFRFTIKYISRGLEFKFTKTSVIMYGNEQTDFIRTESPYDGMTVDSTGIGSTVDEILEAHGHPDEIDNADKTYTYNDGITFEFDSNFHQVIAISIFEEPE